MTKRSFILCACALSALAIFGCNDSKDWNPPPVCGNGVLELGEACEKDLAVNVACSFFDPKVNWVSGRPQCSSNCRLEIGTCASDSVPVTNKCGNGVKDEGEACDGSVDASVTCDSLVSGSEGTVSCNTDCTINSSNCVVPQPCGNGTLDDGEECDGTAVKSDLNIDCGADKKLSDTPVCIASTCTIDITASCVDDVTTCEDDTDCAEVEGKTKCDEEKKICVADTTPVEVSCDDDTDCAAVEGKPKCDETSKICVADADEPCTDGEVKCVPLAGIQGYIAYAKCVDGVWEEDATKCDEGKICNCGAGEDATCASEAEACIVNENPDCTENDIKCVDSSTYQVCNAAYGLWSTGIGECSELGENLVCDKNQNKCVPAATCSSDDDCAAVEGKPKCDEEKKICVTAASECTTNDDCKDESKPVCKENVCVADTEPECTTNDDCKDESKPVCKENVCVADTEPECTTSDDCKDESKPVCKENVCVADSGSGEWAEIVAAPAAYTDADKDVRVSFVETEGNTFATKTLGDYINSGSWVEKSDTVDFEKKYVKIILSAEEISALAGKTTIGTTFKYASNGTNVAEMRVAFFNGDTMIGSACIAAVEGTTQKTLELDSCNVEFSSTTDLHMRIIGVSSTGTSSKSALRIYPITISAK